MHGNECTSWLLTLELSLCGSNLHSFRPKRCKASKDLTDENAKAPDISLVIVASTDQYFWCSVLRCATISPRFLSLHILELLRETKIYQLDVTMCVQQYIFWLQVTEYHVSLM